MGLKNVVHESFEGSWGISESKWYHLKLKMATISFEGSFRDVWWVHFYLVITSQVNFKENLSPM